MDDISGLAVGAPVEHQNTYCSNLLNIPGTPNYDQSNEQKKFYCTITGSECMAYSFMKSNNSISQTKSYNPEAARMCPGYDKTSKHRIVLWRIGHEIKKHQEKIARTLLSELEKQVDALEKQHLKKK